MRVRCIQRRFRLLGHARELRPVGADIGHVMGNDQLVLGVDGGLQL